MRVEGGGGGREKEGEAKGEKAVGRTLGEFRLERKPFFFSFPSFLTPSFVSIKTI